MKKVAFHTLGCKLNFAESSMLSREIDSQSWESVNFRDHADVYVVHSCSVTQNAERKCISAIRKAHKKNPKAQIAVIGCMSQLNPEKILGEKGVKLVLGNEEKYDLPSLIDKLSADNKLVENTKKEKFHLSWSSNDRTRSFLKVQDGCENFCSYCTIPLARGKSRSAKIVEVIQVCKEIAKNDVHELVIGGVNLGDFGRMNGENLYQLLLELEENCTIPRIRLSSIEPDLLTDEIIKHFSESKILMPHFHIPLQAGSDGVLKRMERKYDTELFSGRIKLIKTLMPDACVATDIICGFPGETEEEFNDACSFVKSLALSYMHVFSFSSRPNTRAASLEGKLDKNIISERSHILHEISREKKLQFYDSMEGKSVKVLFESTVNKGNISGFSENYIRVKLPYEESYINTIRDVKLSKIDSDGIFLTEK